MCANLQILPMPAQEWCPNVKLKLADSVKKKIVILECVGFQYGVKCPKELKL